MEPEIDLKELPPLSIAVNEKLLKQLGDGEDKGAKRHGGQLAKAFVGRLSGRERARIAPVLKEAERAYSAFAKAKPFWVCLATA